MCGGIIDNKDDLFRLFVRYGLICEASFNERRNNSSKGLEKLGLKEYEKKINSSIMDKHSIDKERVRLCCKKRELACGVRNHSIKLMKKGAKLFGLESTNNFSLIHAKVEKILEKNYQEVYKKKA